MFKSLQDLRDKMIDIMFDSDSDRSFQNLFSYKFLFFF